MFGYRLMAIDGTIENVPESLENQAAFGRKRGSRGPGGFPQLQNVHLVEVGTHAICDSIVRGQQYGERSAALRLLRSVNEGMLLMWDTGFHGYNMILKTLERGAQFLGRVPAQCVFKPIQHLPDGSFISEIYRNAHDRNAGRKGTRVRLVEYTIDDPGRKGHRQLHRLVTSLLDPKIAPAKLLAAEYHQRWEIEITIDEMDTHQRVYRGPMRSQKPIGVIQEAYGLLIAHYLVRFFMHEAAMESRVDPDRLSFTGSLRVIRRKFDKFQIADSDQTALLYDRMIKEISKKTLPQRDNRSNPRVVKKKKSKYKQKRPEHKGIRPHEKTFQEVIRLLN